MAKIPTNIAMALKCAAKVRMGKACTMKELKATVLLLNDARKSGLKSLKMARDMNAFLERFINR